MFGHLGASKKRWGAMAGASVALVFGAMVLFPSNAWAVDDSVDSWQINYTVGTDGVVHVEETLIYRFGSDSGRHGIDRTFVTREAWGNTDQDATYFINHLKVTSPNAPSRTWLDNEGSGRNQQLRVRIGSLTYRITSPTATYRLTYDVVGAMRSSDSYDEFYWNVISGNTPLVQDITVTVTVPGGAQDVAC